MRAQGIPWQQVTRIGLVAGAMFLSCALWACDLSTAQPSSTATAVVPVPRVPATPIPPSAMPIPTIIGANQALLGGSVAAFDKKFGANYCCSHDYWDGMVGPYGQMDVTVITKEDGSRWDEHSLHRVIEIATNLESNTPTYGIMSPAQATAMCGAFMPPDAKYLGRTRSVPFAGSIIGQEKTYSSRLLANTLPAADFVDRTGKAVQSGTFFEYFDQVQVPTGTYRYCALGTDESIILPEGALQDSTRFQTKPSAKW